VKKVVTYRDLDVWQASMRLVEQTYIVTRSFPDDERFGLTSQLRRAAVSVAANIAEGAARHTTRAFANHVSIALGSHAEMETCFDIAARLRLAPRAEIDKLIPLISLVGRLLNGLLKSLEVKLHP
jgi:four helix bundle protein